MSKEGAAQPKSFAPSPSLSLSLSRSLSPSPSFLGPLCDLGICSHAQSIDDNGTTQPGQFEFVLRPESIDELDAANHTTASLVLPTSGYNVTTSTDAQGTRHFDFLASVARSIGKQFFQRFTPRSLRPFFFFCASAVYFHLSFVFPLPPFFCACLPTAPIVVHPFLSRNGRRVSVVISLSVIRLLPNHIWRVCRGRRNRRVLFAHPGL